MTNIADSDSSFEIVTVNDEDEYEIVDNNRIQDAINGEWKLEESRNMKLFLKNYNDKEVRYRYEAGCPNYRIEGNKLTTFVRIPMCTSEVTTYILGEICILKGVSTSHFIENNRLITLKKNMHDGKEITRIERFIENGRLKIVMQKDDLSCERVFTKISGS